MDPDEGYGSDIEVDDRAGDVVMATDILYIFVGNKTYGIVGMKTMEGNLEHLRDATSKQGNEISTCAFTLNGEEIPQNRESQIPFKLRKIHSNMALNITSWRLKLLRPDFNKFDLEGFKTDLRKVSAELEMDDHNNHVEWCKCLKRREELEEKWSTRRPRTTWPLKQLIMRISELKRNTPGPATQPRHTTELLRARREPEQVERPRRRMQSILKDMQDHISLTAWFQQLSVSLQTVRPIVTNNIDMMVCKFSAEGSSRKNVQKDVFDKLCSWMDDLEIHSCTVEIVGRLYPNMRLLASVLMVIPVSTADSEVFQGELHVSEGVDLGAAEEKYLHERRRFRVGGKQKYFYCGLQWLDKSAGNSAVLEEPALAETEINLMILRTMIKATEMAQGGELHKVTETVCYTVRDLESKLHTEQRRHQETLKNLRENEHCVKELRFQACCQNILLNVFLQESVNELVDVDTDGNSVQTASYLQEMEDIGAKFEEIMPSNEWLGKLEVESSAFTASPDNVAPRWVRVMRMATQMQIQKLVCYAKGQLYRLYRCRYRSQSIGKLSVHSQPRRRGSLARTPADVIVRVKSLAFTASPDKVAPRQQMAEPQSIDLSVLRKDALHPSTVDRGRTWSSQLYRCWHSCSSKYPQPPPPL
ncbi:hypothetical protein Bbelb_048970 [Branchiostoma belcheri]|nr:hypothetical protein Bbelb_048970 [Branchiostoma belcheri]